MMGYFSVFDGYYHKKANCAHMIKAKSGRTIHYVLEPLEDPRHGGMKMAGDKGIMYRECLWCTA